MCIRDRLNALGWPVGMQMGMETASFSLSVGMVGGLGTLALASHQIMLTISQFTFMTVSYTHLDVYKRQAMGYGYQCQPEIGI